jgi:hypothetical protein
MGHHGVVHRSQQTHLVYRSPSAGKTHFVGESSNERIAAVPDGRSAGVDTGLVDKVSAKAGQLQFRARGSELPMRKMFPRSGAGERGVHLCPPGQPGVAGRHLLEQPTDPIAGSGQ